MLVGYMRVSSDSDRQSTDLQRDTQMSPPAWRHILLNGHYTFHALVAGLELG
jgi:hypothetical protein